MSLLVRAGVAPSVTESAPAGRRSALRQLTVGLLEIAVAATMALGFTAWSRTIQVSPLDRIGQISGLAALQLRFAALALCLLVIMLVGWRSRWRDAVVRLVCAAVAGLATGMVAGGQVVALLGSPWPLLGSDVTVIVGWADLLRAGGQMPASYPPLFIQVLAWWADVTDTSSLRALKPLELAATSLFGPAAYLAWRTLLPPLWALGIGLVAALPLIDPYKPYTPVVLVVLLPTLVLFVRSLRGCGAAGYPRVVMTGAAFGTAFAVLFLVYSGWFVWSAPGVAVAVLLHFPWRTGWLRGLAFLGISALCFSAISARHLIGLLFSGNGVKDRYFYFDVYVDPAYIAMMRGDLPGQPGPWPPPGELGGVGLFTVLLAVGLGTAIAFGMRNSMVITACCLLVSGWLLRFYLAAQTYRLQAVQLYPRTTAEILYCLLILSGSAVYLLSQQISVHRLLDPRSNHPGSATNRPLATTAGALCGLLLLFASIGSSVSDRYMPRNDNSLGALAWASHHRWPGGGCSVHVPGDQCDRPARPPLRPQAAT